MANDQTTVEITLNTPRLKSDLDQAHKMVAEAVEKMKATLAPLGQSLAGLRQGLAGLKPAGGKDAPRGAPAEAHVPRIPTEGLEEAREKLRKSSRGLRRDTEAVYEPLREALKGVQLDTTAASVGFRKLQEDIDKSMPAMLGAINGTFGQLDAAMVGPVAEAVGAVTTIMERGMGRVARAVGDMVRTNEFEFKRLRDIASSILDDIASDMLRVGVVAPLSDLLRGGLTSLLPKQHGGPVLPRIPYLVGEAGPKLFVPAAAGAIVPHNRLAGAGRAAAATARTVVNFHQTFNFDFRGANPAAVAVLRTEGDRIIARTKAAILDDILRNGPIGRAIR